MHTNNFYEQVWEYLLVISPPEEVKNSIGRIKKEVGIKYGSQHALHSTAHISLVKFLLIKGCERNLLAHLFSFCVNKPQFDIALNNYDVFPQHTLYVNVLENEGIRKLQNGLTALLMSRVLVRERYIRTGRKHHMTIARNLDSIQFNSIVNEYGKKQISASFRAKNIVMLKRPFEEYNQGSYRWCGRHNFILGCN